MADTPNLWAGERQGDDVYLGLRTRATLLHERSPYQEILIVDTLAYGRALFLDGTFQLTEKDEFAYHEMLAHPALCAHVRPQRVLIIGGGDGGTLRETLRHDEVTSAVLCEIDKSVTDAARRYLPTLAEGLDSERAELRFEDGAAYVAGFTDHFDVILIDSPDPVGPAELLYDDSFYAACHKALRPGGIVAAQSESPFVNGDVLRRVALGMTRTFGTAHVYLGPVPTYPSGSWSYTAAGKDVDPSVPRRRPSFATRYYDEAMHRAAFVLPPFVRELIRS